MPDDILALAKFYLPVHMPCNALWDGCNKVENVLVSYIIRVLIKRITLLVEN